MMHPCMHATRAKRVIHPRRCGASSSSSLPLCCIYIHISSFCATRNILDEREREGGFRIALSDVNQFQGFARIFARSQKMPFVRRRFEGDCVCAVASKDEARGKKKRKKCPRKEEFPRVRACTRTI